MTDDIIIPKGKGRGKGPGQGGGQGGGGPKKALRRAMLTLLGGLAGAPAAQAAEAPAAPAAPKPTAASTGGGGPNPVEETVVYKTVGGTSLSMMIAKPTTPPPASGWPCAVFFHGGGYRNGTPEKFTALGLELARHGVMSASVQYRFLAKGERIPKNAIADGRSAMRYLRGKAAALHIDPNRIAAGGGSAGGHLAFMTWIKSPFDESTDDLSISPRPQALILLNTGYNMETRFNSKQAIPFSPIHQLTPDLPPTIMFHGTADTTAPYADAVSFRDKAQAVGVKDITLVTLEGRKHGFFHGEQGTGADFKSVTEQIVGFLRRLGWAT